MTHQTHGACSSAVHIFYADAEVAGAVARAKSRDGSFYVARKCSACTGWRLKRVS